MFPIHADHLGAPRVVLDTQNPLRWTWLAEPFGTTAANDNPQGLGPFTFNLRLPGQYFDVETGLHHNGQRDYDPTLGRFIQSDPAGLEGGVDAYGYAMSRPTAFTDPTGELVPIAAGCAANPACAAAVATAIRGISLAISRCASNTACVDRWRRAAGTLVASAWNWVRTIEQRAKDAAAEAASGQQCRDECDPPEGTLCSVYHENSTPHTTRNINGNSLGKQPNHVHIWRMNKGPKGCMWNSQTALNYTPISARPCTTYPSWVAQHGR